MLLIKNALYYSKDRHFVKGNLLVNGAKIISTSDVQTSDNVLDLKGYRVIPGLVDIHTHGAIGIDAMSADNDSFMKLSRFYAQNGVTSFMPTTITAGNDAICSTLQNIKNAAETDDMAASIVGAHIEGPFISTKHKGCHDENLICGPHNADFDRYKNVLGDGLKLRFTVAPEIEGAREFIEYVCKNDGIVTIGHCDAGYEQCIEALSLGANCFTHLFNAMRGLHHREPGTVGAAFLSNAYTELICDGIHLHPDIIKLVYQIKGIDKIILITDSMCATCMKDGEYLFGGMNITVKYGVARTSDGTLAGSTLLLINALKNFVKFTGLPLEQAIPAATINPARAIGIDKSVGSIEVGKRADLVVLDENMNVAATICAGRVVYNKI